MILTGILNPDINSLLSRVRHTNTLVIADYRLPLYPGVETIDIGLMEDVPGVIDVIKAIRLNFSIGQVVQNKEFLVANSEAVCTRYAEGTKGLAIEYLASKDFKNRISQAIGIIRTGETAHFGSIIIESA